MPIPNIVPDIPEKFPGDLFGSEDVNKIVTSFEGVQGALDGLDSGKANVLTRTTALVIETDFYTNTSPFAQGLAGTAVSSGTVSVVTTPSANNPGVIALRDSTTANGGYRVMTDVAALRLAGGEKSIIVFQVRGVRAGMTAFFGFFDSTSITAPTDCVCLVLTANGTTASMGGRTRANNTATNSASPFAPAVNTWYMAEILVNSGATNATFTIYNDQGTELWTDTLANIPTAAGRELGWGIAAYESSTDAAADLVWLDYARMEINRPLTR